MRTIAAASAALAVVTACSTQTSAPDVAAFEALAADTQARVSRYQAAWAAAPAAGAADCLAVDDPYHVDVKPMLQRMVGMAPGMDDWMDSHGMADAADMACGSTVTMDELEGHHAVACQGTPAEMAAEAARHAGAMIYDTNHMGLRAGQMRSAMGGMMGGGMGPGMMDAGPPMTGCFAADGGFQTDAGYWWDGGWMMDGGFLADGGMMGDGGMP
jgi:hypothetical protein